MEPTIRVYPNGSLDTRRFDRAFIGISLKSGRSQNFSELAKVVDWTREHVGQFDFFVGDFLNRHNYEAFDGMTESSAAETAMQLGKKTSEQLENLLVKRLIEDATVLSARALYLDPSIVTRQAAFSRQYQERSEFRALIDEAVVHFLKRVHHRDYVDDSVRAHCVAYQIEELALFELLAERGYGTLVYAGPQLPVMKAVASRSLSGVSPILEKLTLVELRFVRTK